MNRNRFAATKCLRVETIEFVIIVKKFRITIQFKLYSKKF